MARKLYTVENQRPRRTVNLYGTILAPKGKGRTSCTDLSLEEVLGSPSVRLLAVGRLSVVRGDTSPVDSAVARFVALQDEASSPDSAPTPVAEEVIPPVVEKVEEPKVEEVISLSAPPAEPEEGSSTPVLIVPDLVAPSAEPDESPTGEVWTADSLKAMSASEQKAICRELGVAVGGKEDERIQRILDHTVSPEGE